MQEVTPGQLGATLKSKVLAAETLELRVGADECGYHASGHPHPIYFLSCLPHLATRQKTQFHPLQREKVYTIVGVKGFSFQNML